VAFFVLLGLLLLMIRPRVVASPRLPAAALILAQVPYDRGVMSRLADLPGWEIVDVGLHDLEDGRRDSIPALVVSIGAPRLGQLGITVTSPVADAEHTLYELLAAEDPDAAHGRYNALVRRLVSFERAAACAG
jgi:hypothetical protein